MKIISLEGRSWGDERGWGLRPLLAAGVDPGRLGEMHVVSLEPGAVRGNHAHPDTTEWMLLFGGPVTLAWHEQDKAPEQVVLPHATPTLVELPPGVAHAVRCEADRATYLVSWADGEPRTRRLTEPLL